MDVRTFRKLLDADFYTGVPDSLLRPLLDDLMETYGTDPRHHIIAANEGNAAALAAGYHLATGKVPVVYLQNSGEGNLVNPAASLLHPEVYGIPVIFVIGWRGEPGVHDEPQHVFQGRITGELMRVLETESVIVGADTDEAFLQARMEALREALQNGKSVALIVQKDALTYDGKRQYANGETLSREEAIRRIVHFAKEDPVIATTGKAGRELYEIREADGTGHAHDFLTVGSMGHASSIALGIALQRPKKKIWCIDGDGAALMHLGAMATTGRIMPANLVHIIINNGAHESVGGAPTTAEGTDFCAVAASLGYPQTLCVRDVASLDAALREACGADHLMLIEVRCAIGARADLGRPKETPSANKEAFVRELRN